MRCSGLSLPGIDTGVDAARTSAHTTNAVRITVAATLFFILWTFTPPVEPRIRLCGFFWLTGHPCALCGLTRAMFAMAKGHFSEAVHFNALAPLGFAMVFSLFWTGKITARLWTAGVAAFTVYGLWRIFMTQ